MHRQEVPGLPQVAEQPERPVDHVTGAGRDLGAAAEAGQVVADLAVVLLDRKGQVLAGEVLFLRDQPAEALLGGLPLQAEAPRALAVPAAR